MKKVFSLLLSWCVFSTYAQQTISDWKYQKDMSSNPQNFIKAGKKIYFLASTPEHGRELWVTEGTTESTKLVKDIMVGENSSFVEPSNYQDYIYYNFLTNIAPLEDGTLYFVASDNPNEKPKIWVTDGTEKGTKLYQNEVKGSLFYTGDELVEYFIDGVNDNIKIFHQDSKRDSVLNIGSFIKQSTNSNYRPNTYRTGNLLTLTYHYSESGLTPSYLVTFDLKEQKVKVKAPKLPFQGGNYHQVLQWKNDIYVRGTISANSVFVGRMNSNTGKFDTLAVIPQKNTTNGVYLQTFLTATPKEILFITNDLVYELVGNLFVLKANQNDYKFAFNYYNNFYDSSDDVMYTYKNDYDNKTLIIRGVRLSDGKSVKDLTLKNKSFAGRLINSKVIVSETDSLRTFILDIKTEKSKEFLHKIGYQSFIPLNENILFGGKSSQSSNESELFVYDDKSEETKLLKNINTTGISTPRVFTTTFNGKLIQVYSNEQGIMLGVSDGTKTGTKDLKLLVKNQNIPSLAKVEFQEFNQRLGIYFIIRTDNGDHPSTFDGFCSTCVDSSFLFTVDKNFMNIDKLVSDRIYTTGGFNFITPRVRISKTYKDRLEVDVSNNTANYSPITCVTDLTPQNTVISDPNNFPLITNDNFSIIAGTVPGKYLYERRKYLAKYDIKTQKVDTIANSINYSSYQLIDDKVYFYTENVKKLFVTDGLVTQEIPGINTILSPIKIKNKILFIENFNKGYATPNVNNRDFVYDFSIFQIENNLIKRLLSTTAITQLHPSFSSKIWEFKGKTYLILNIPPPYQSNKYITQFYEIKNDFSFVKVYEMENNSSNVLILSKGIVFVRGENDVQVYSVMNDSFQPKVVYRSKTKDRLQNEAPVDYSSRKYFAFYSGSMFVTDGSVDGSIELLDNNINTGIAYQFFNKYQIDNNPDKFFFSFFPATEHGVNLWITDGTKNGTLQLINQKVNIDRDLVYANELLGKLGNKYLFRKPSANSLEYEVWTTEGTPLTTQKLKDANNNILSQPILPYYDSKGWQNLPKINNKLYFSRQTEKNGYEPWVTDGTPEGTKMMGDLVKGIQSSNPFQFVEINQLPYCIATEENKSLQLWSFCNPKVSLNVEKIAPTYTEEVKLLATQNNDWKYQWLKDGKDLDKANATTFTATTSGTYQIKVEDKIGCTNVSDSIVIKFTQKILANEELTDEFELKVFPNPAQNDLNLTFEGNNKGVFQLSLYDLSGRLLINQEVQSNTVNTISTQNLSTGSYFIRLTNGEKQTIRKVIKN